MAGAAWLPVAGKAWMTALTDLALATTGDEARAPPVTLVVGLVDGLKGEVGPHPAGS